MIPTIMRCGFQIAVDHERQFMIDETRGSGDGDGDGVGGS
jgi:hypothetical protein